MKQMKASWHKVNDDYRAEMQYKEMLRARRQTIATYLATHPVRKLQIGAGTNPLPGWLNSDLEPTGDGIIFLDATDTFPIDDETFDYVFSEHMIEHIPYKDGLFMLGEVYRILQPGGKVRIATPDLAKIVGLYAPEKTAIQKRYLAWSTEKLGLTQAERTIFQQRRPEWDLDHRHVQRFYPDAGTDTAGFIVNNFFRSYGHQFLYDAQALTAALKEAGFVNVRPSLPGESDDEHLRGIESHHELIGTEMNGYETFVLEAVRPDAPGR